MGLTDETHIVYVSPLKALSNDIHKNLEAPIAGIRAELERLGLPDVDIRTFVRTGDTPQASARRCAGARRTSSSRRRSRFTSCSTSESGRKMLATTRTVIVDEIHAIAPNKRGAHLALSLERLQALAGRELVRIGLSATQKPIERDREVPGRAPVRTKRRYARSSTPATCASAISPSSCRLRRSKR